MPRHTLDARFANNRLMMALFWSGGCTYLIADARSSSSNRESRNEHSGPSNRPSGFHADTSTVHRSVPGTMERNPENDDPRRRPPRTPKGDRGEDGMAMLNC